MASAVPERIAWAVELVDPSPGERILEFGCGPGVAAALVADRLNGGRLVAIDRSATAVDRTRARTAEHLRSGRVVVQQVELAQFGGEPGFDEFDKAFAVNVNVFWTGSADAECRVLARVLRPGGLVHLVYGGPPGARAGVRDIEPVVIGNLERHGFTTAVRRDPARALVGISGRYFLDATVR
jgi:SAM-dependent methyltransferase